MKTNKIYHWDCLDVLKTFPDNSIDSIVTDPPYWLSFMWKKRDYDVPSQELWEECFRVLKPWWHLLAFAWTRTQHRMAVRIEDAGFEIKDMIAWVYGSWFPKSHNIGKAVDKLQGDEREIVKNETRYNYHSGIVNIGQGEKKLINRVVTKGTSKYEGWGTALKPALEPITVARKPISEKTIAENVLKWGTGGINIDESRVSTEDDLSKRYKTSFQEGNSQFVSQTATNSGKRINIDIPKNITAGRFPANLIHDGSDEVLELFPETKSGAVKNTTNNFNWSNNINIWGWILSPENSYWDSGSASRFFYCAKASKSERNKWTDNYLIFNINLQWEENIELDELQQNDMLEKIKLWFIDWFGKKWIDQSQIDFKFTIKIETKKIMILVILNFLVHLNIKGFTADVIEMKNDNGENHVESVENTSQLKQIITKELTEYLHDVNNVVLPTQYKTSVSGSQNNFHSTVKPLKLMEYLVRLVTPKWWICLDPFIWSWTTAVACKTLWFDFIGIEREEEYIEIANKRLEGVPKPKNIQQWLF